MEFRTFDEVLAEREALSPGVAGSIAELLEMLEGPAAGRQASQNIRDEHLVEEGVWNALVDTLLQCASGPATYESIHDAVRDVMREHKLEGPPATCPAGTVFGRATQEEDLAYTLHSDGYSGSSLWAQRSVRYAKTLKRGDLRVWWDGVKLGQYVMWATFNAKGRSPFADLGETADAIRANLGLPKRHEGKRLLLLEYTLLPERARIPRVTEAYAGNVWTHYFRPAGTRERKLGYGRTFPWDELAEEAGAGEPEVVHEPITGRHLESEITEIA